MRLHAPAVLVLSLCSTPLLATQAAGTFPNTTQTNDVVFITRTSTNAVGTSAVARPGKSTVLGTTTLGKTITPGESYKPTITSGQSGTIASTSYGVSVVAGSCDQANTNTDTCSCTAGFPPTCSLKMKPSQSDTTKLWGTPGVDGSHPVRFFHYTTSPGTACSTDPDNVAWQAMTSKDQTSYSTTVTYAVSGEECIKLDRAAYAGNQRAVEIAKAKMTMSSPTVYSLTWTRSL